MSTRIRVAPKRFGDETFLPGANNKYTIDRKIDAGHDAAPAGGGADDGTARERWDVARVEADERESDFIVDDVESEEEDEEDEESEGSESESESEEEDEESE